MKLTWSFALQPSQEHAELQFLQEFLHEMDVERNFLQEFLHEIDLELCPATFTKAR